MSFIVSLNHYQFHDQDKMSLIPHCRRVNLRAGQIKAAYQKFPEIPDPKRHGWIPSDSH